MNYYKQMFKENFEKVFCGGKKEQIFNRDGRVDRVT